MNSMIHIKAHYNGNIRRFQSQVEWPVLLKNLQVFFQIDPSLPVKIQYRDDENDMCTFSTQMELESATSDCSLLRLFITATEPARPVIQTSQSCRSFPCARLSAIKTTPAVPSQMEERFNRRKSMIEARMAQQTQSPCNDRKGRCWPRRASNDPVAFGPAAHLERINKALEDPALPAQRRERLLLKKAWIEQKLAQKTETPEAPSTAVTDQAPRCWGNPAMRLEKIKAKLSDPNLPPHRVEQLNQKKAFLEKRLEQSPEVASDCPPRPWGLQARLEGINQKLANTQLPPHRVQMLQFKKAMIEEKLKNQQNPQVGTENAAPCRGPEARLGWIKMKLATPNLPPQCAERLTRKKTMLEEKIKMKQNPEAAQNGGCWGLEARLAWIQKRLADPSLPPVKAEKLNAKKAKIEEKMKMMQGLQVQGQNLPPHCARKMWGHGCRAERMHCRK
jgi:antitoxin (DNA-binding transcriptional repressor) of toxin-antitoxin stability system